MPYIPTPRTPIPAADHCWPVPPQDSLKQFCLSLCGVPGSRCTQGLFEPSEPIWQEQGLILNEFAPSAILLGLLLCPWTWDSSSQPLQCLPSYWGFSDLERGVSPHGCWSWPWMWGISSRLLSAPAPRSHAVVKWNQITEFDQRNDSGNDVISVKMPKSRCALFKFLLCSSYLMLHNKSPPNLKLWNNFIMLIVSIAYKCGQRISGMGCLCFASLCP